MDVQAMASADNAVRLLHQIEIEPPAMRGARVHSADNAIAATAVVAIMLSPASIAQ